MHTRGLRTWSTFGLLVVAVLLLLGWDQHGLGRIGHAARPHSIAGSSITPNPTTYLPGSANNYTLAVSNASTDGEFLDRVEVNFPSGWVISAMSGEAEACFWPVKLVASGVGTNQAAFTDADGFVGEIPLQCTWNATVTVDVPSGSSGNQVVQWSLSGDEMAPFGPHDVSGSFQLSAVQLQPAIAVSPTTLSAILQPGQSEEQTLTIENEGIADLTWNLAEAPGVGWLGESPTNGTIGPGGTGQVEITFDATALAPGPYSTSLRITSNDSNTPQLDVPVSLTVRPMRSYIYLPVVTRDYSPNLFYFDDFSDPNSGWYSGETARTKVGYLGGEYQILLKEKRAFAGVTADLVLPASYRIAVDAHQASTNAGSYGLIFGVRWSGSEWEGHQFMVFPGTQQYLLEKRNMSGSWSMVIDQTFSPAIHGGMATNHLRVDRVGRTIALYVNGTMVATATDGDYASAGRDGGVRAYGYDLVPVDMRFDNFAVYQVDAGRFYHDDFNDPASGWESCNDAVRACGYLGGEYQIRLKVNHTGWLVTPNLMLPANYRVEADARQASANPGSYGLIIGIDSGDNSYEGLQFLVYPDTQEYYLEKRSLDGAWTTLINWTPHAAIQQGAAANRLHAERNGTTFSFYVNGVLMATHMTSDFATRGRDAGMCAYSYDSPPVDMRFDNFVVYAGP